MAHSEHNKKRGGGFALIIFGALLLFLAPNIQSEYPQLSFVMLFAGFIVGGIGFYINFFKNRYGKR